MNSPIIGLKQSLQLLLFPLPYQTPSYKQTVPTYVLVSPKRVEYHTFDSLSFVSRQLQHILLVPISPLTCAFNLQIIPVNIIENPNVDGYEVQVLPDAVADHTRSYIRVRRRFYRKDDP